MRRTLGSGLLLLALTSTMAPSLTVDALAADERAAGSHDTALARRATQALTRAQDALAGRGGDATMALVELRRAYPHLTASQQREADAIFARPTDGNGPPPPGGTGDPWGDGYETTEAVPACGPNVCVHYVATTDDAPEPTDLLPEGTPNGIPDFVDAALAEMEKVWTYEVTTRGYRKPASDVTLTNNGSYDDGGTQVNGEKFDVYLANITPDALYGYCAPEAPVVADSPNPNQQFRAIGFCVLDDDYVGYPGTPEASLAVTAAHEFFHAIQFNYDAWEDSWIMEATATWMEERYADAVNDNRQYLSDSHMAKPTTPLDRFSANGEQYGNWTFIERLSKVYGIDIVKKLWLRLDASPAGPDAFSLQGVSQVIAARGSTFRNFYAAFAAANILPAKFYEEGSAWAPFASPITRNWTLAPWKRSVTGKQTALAHLTSRNYGFVPASSMKGTWYLTIKVDGPAAITGSAAQVLIIRRNGTVTSKPVTLSNAGDGRLRVPFGVGTIKRITLTVSNGSTRYQCWQSQSWSCQGTPLDNGRVYKFSAAASR